MMILVLSVSYTGADWVIRAVTTPDAHSIGLDAGKKVRAVPGPKEHLLDNETADWLQEDLQEMVQEFMSRLRADCLHFAPGEHPELF